MAEAGSALVAPATKSRRASMKLSLDSLTAGIQNPLALMQSWSPLSSRWGGEGEGWRGWGRMDPTEQQVGCGRRRRMEEVGRNGSH